MKSLLPFLFFLLSLSAWGQKLSESELRNLLKTHSGISTDQLEMLKLKSYYTDKNGKLSVCWLHPTHQGRDLWNTGIQLVLNNQNKVVRIQNKLNPVTTFQQSNTILSFEEVVAKHVHLFRLNPLPIRKLGEKDGFETYQLNGLSKELKVKKIWFFKENNWIKAYQVYFENLKADGFWLYILSESTGEIVFSKNIELACKHESENPFLGLKSNPFTHNHEHSLAPDVTETSETLANESYLAFHFPVESPIHGNQTLKNNPADATASPLGWLIDNPTGVPYTYTRGNNVWAYEDKNNVDEPGIFANQSNTGEFIYTYDANLDPVSLQDAAITNLFVANNFIHDFAFEFGFDEFSGNFQTFNFTNDFGNDDAVRAEAFDGSGTNNANFGTPEDGFAPRMQMYLWFQNEGQLLTINSPESLAGPYQSALATFGQQLVVPGISAPLALFNDGSNSPTLACNGQSPGVFGKIAVIDRGTCTFTQKVRNAQLSGAVAVIVVNNQNNGVISMGVSGDASDISIPSIMITQTAGNQIKQALNLGVEITGTIQTGGGSGNVFDSNFDNGVIAHEYGHGISNRLTGGPDDVFCLFNEEQAGEGWSDFMALVMTTTSANTANEARGIGNFVSGLPTTGGGIRPFPYSRNMAVNPVTYSYVGQLSVPHGVGSVWCSMIWDMYWNMVDKYGYSEDYKNQSAGNNKAIKLVFDGMRFQFCSPGFVDSRDAIFLADELNNNNENYCLLWKTFARRGLGLSADQGSSDFVGDEVQAFDIPSDCITAIDEVNQNNAHKGVLGVFPNPTQNETTVVLQPGFKIEHVQLLSADGKILPTQRIFYQSDDYLVKVDLTHLSSGIYILHMVNGAGSYQVKLIKQ